MVAYVSFIPRIRNHTAMSVKRYDKQKQDTRNAKRNSVFLYILIIWCAMSIISFPEPCDAQKATEQKTTGDKSPNIYAPKAKQISVTYGVSEKFVNDLMQQLNGKDKIIASLLDDLKEKNVTIKVMDAQIQEWIATVKELNKQPTKSSSIKQVSALKALTPYEFLDNSVIFHSYIQYRKTLQLLNPDMLVKLLDVYFRSVLLYPSSTKKDYYITAPPPDGRLLLLKFEGHNDKGQQISLSLPDMSASLLQDVCIDFVKSANLKQYELIENLFDRALSTPELDKIHKINVLDAKNFILKNKLLLNG
jgi:hypothetical protein